MARKDSLLQFQIGKFLAQQNIERQLAEAATKAPEAARPTTNKTRTARASS